MLPIAPTSSGPLPRCAPEEVGLPSISLLEFLDGVPAKNLELHSAVVLRRGHVVAEGWWAPYRREDRHLLYSLSKSFTSTAVGFALAEGRLTLDDPVLGFFPEDGPPEPSADLRTLRVRHLLTMTVGHNIQDRLDMLSSQDGNWVRPFLARPFAHAPGSVFFYSSAATYMLAAILDRVTGETLVDYLRPRLFDPLGIGEVTWESDPRGINVGGWGLSITTEEIARFGLMYLRQGEWAGRPLLSPEWIAEATRKHIGNEQNESPDWQQGYGFQFWRCQHGAYRGDGAFGQFCVVHPEGDLVVAITARTDDMQAILDLIWTHLLPALSNRPLAADPDAHHSLQTRLRGLALIGPLGEPTSPWSSRISGRTYRDAAGESPYESVRLDFEGAPRLTLHGRGGETSLLIGVGTWAEGEVLFDGGPARVAVWGAWTDDDTYIVRLQYLETPASTDLTFRFGEGGIEVQTTRRGNLYLPAEAPTFRGA
ncbi:MAG: serine hydrolase domain-containing protein [Fimbriimonas sp.]